MDRATLNALKGSIKHWEDNVKAMRFEEANVGPEHCALCMEFFDLDCEGCPVRRFTGHRGCGGTPYGEAENAYYLWDEASGAVETIRAREEFQARAREELEFLINLLPTTERAKYTEQK